MTFDPTDIQAIVAAEQEAQQRRLADDTLAADALVLVMQSREGRRLVWHIIDRSGCNGPSFDPSVPDPCVTAFNEGRRRVGLELQNQLYALSPDLYDVMLRERAAEQAQRKKEREAQ